MGHARKKTEAEPEDAKVLPAREALSLISSRPPDEDEDEDDSGRSEEPLVDHDWSVEGARNDRSTPET
jgi:hypothetical protein